MGRYTFTTPSKAGDLDFSYVEKLWVDLNRKRLQQRTTELGSTTEPLIESYNVVDRDRQPVSIGYFSTDGIPLFTVNPGFEE